jgi:hypothetical protein
MTPEEIEERLDILDKTLDRLKVIYEQYFLGIQKAAPAYLHTDVERKLRELTQIQIRNTGLRYRFATVQQKFGAYNSYWRRTLRQIENGTYSRNLSKIGRQAARTGEEIPEEILAAMPKRMRDQVVRDRDLALAQAARRKHASDELSDDELLTLAPIPEEPPEDVPAVISEPTDLRRNLRTRSGAHVIEEEDGSVDLAAFFAEVEQEAEAAKPAPPAPSAPAPLPPPAAKPTGPVAPVGVRAASISTPPIQRPVAPRAGQSGPFPKVLAPTGTQPGVQPMPPRPPAAPHAERPAAPASATTTGPVPRVAAPASATTTGPVPRVAAPASATTTGPVPRVPAPASATTTGPVPRVPAPASATTTGPVPRVPGPAPTPPPRPEKPLIPGPPVASGAPRPAAATTTGSIPKLPAVPRAPSQITRPNPIAPGAAAARGTVDVESMAGPFPRVPTEPAKPAPRAPTAQPRPPARAPTDGGPPQRPPPGMSDADVNALYAKYVQAKEMIGETVGPGGHAKLLKTINAQAPKIMEQYKAKAVDFSVVVKDNQVIIRAKPKT